MWKLSRLKSDYAKIQKKYKKSGKKGAAASGIQSNLVIGETEKSEEIFECSNSSSEVSKSKRPLLTQSANEPARAHFYLPNEMSQQNFESQIVRLNAQLDEQKMKQLELHLEKEKMTKSIENFKRMNQVFSSLCEYELNIHSNIF